MISLLDGIAALAATGALVLLLIYWRGRLSAPEMWVVFVVCALTAGINAASAWEWRDRAVHVVDHPQVWSDHLQILLPVLWGMFFYVVIQSAYRRELRQSHQGMRDLIEHMPVILHAYDQEGRVLAWNRHAEEVTGYSKGEVLGQAGMVQQMFPDEQYQQQLLEECAQGGGSYQHRLRPLLSKQKFERQIAWYNISECFPIPGWANWGIGLDMTDQVKAQKELEHMATHDDLTRLPNRALLRDRLSHALSDAQRNNRKGALLLLDLDHFKMVNDSHGHPVGDQLLQQVGERLRSCIKSTDTLARFGGDEFVILLERVTGPEGAALVAERILASLTNTPFVLLGTEIKVRTSVGITLFPDDDIRLDELIKNVDLALYAAKKSGRNGYHFYSRAMHNRLRWQHRVSERLRSALETESFQLHYQPQIALSDFSVFGVEALLRWNAFDDVPLSPAAFIPIAENMGLMPALGRWVLESACRQAAAWQKADNKLSVAINLSPIQFFQNDLIEVLLAITEEEGLDPQSVEFEITESAVMRNLDVAITTMRRLTKNGFNISLDDFGTGYSSLSYLKRFPISKIKIDQSFVRTLETDPVDAAIVRSVINLGHSLNMKVLAEGVETAGQRDILGNEGCDYIQGFLYSKPLAAESVLAYMGSGGARTLN